jgi:hypothetical protein
LLISYPNFGTAIPKLDLRLKLIVTFG